MEQKDFERYKSIGFIVDEIEGYCGDIRRAWSAIEYTERVGKDCGGIVEMSIEGQKLEIYLDADLVIELLHKEAESDAKYVEENLKKLYAFINQKEN